MSGRKGGVSGEVLNEKTNVASRVSEARRPKPDPTPDEMSLGPDVHILMHGLLGL